MEKRSLFTDEQRSLATSLMVDIRSGEKTAQEAQLALMQQFSMGRILSAKLMELASDALDTKRDMRQI